MEQKGLKLQKNVIGLFFIVTFSCVLISSCQSLVYSPSINLPDEIKKDNTNLIAAYERLPLTSSDEEKNDMNNGFMAALQHSFTNSFMLQAKYWADVNSMNDGLKFKHGLSLNAFIRLNDSNSPYKFYLSPLVAAAFEENVTLMGVFGASASVQTPKFYVFEPFLSVGMFYGSSYNKYYHGNYDGIAIIPNAGAYIPLYGNLKLYLELSFPAVYYSDFATWETFLVPTIGFKYGF
ncbi:MAG: hypothetical protein M9949_00045 [Candidatus Kapabacteria bacterium]|nr:hypothetical protein [Candidatus Kapabacteria bacterium]